MVVSSLVVGLFLVWFVVNSNYDIPIAGSFEQLYMDIAVCEAELVKDNDGQPISTHIEMSATSMLSYIAGLTPFSDFNQSPRNMYQCQVGC